MSVLDMLLHIGDCQVVQFKEVTCPYCGLKTNCSASSEGGAPKPGEYGVCSRCRKPSMFDEKMELVGLDVSSLSPERQEELKQIQAFVARYQPS